MLEDLAVTAYSGAASLNRKRQTLNPKPSAAVLCLFVVQGWFLVSKCFAVLFLFIVQA